MIPISGYFAYPAMVWSHCSQISKGPLYLDKLLNCSAFANVTQYRTVSQLLLMYVTCTHYYANCVDIYFTCRGTIFSISIFPWKRGGGGGCSNNWMVRIIRVIAVLCNSTGRKERVFKYIEIRVR